VPIRSSTKIRFMKRVKKESRRAGGHRGWEEKAVEVQFSPAVGGKSRPKSREERGRGRHEGIGVPC